MSLQALAEFFSKSGMRKIGSLILFYVANALLAARAVITGEQFVTLSVALIAGLVGGNAFEHHTKSKGGKDAPVQPVAAPAPPVGQ